MRRSWVTRVLVPAVVALAVGFWVLALTPASPVHPDTLRDLDLAGRCVRRGQCLTFGAPTSVKGLVQGALWPHLLALVRFAHLSMTTLQTIICVSFLVAAILLGAAVARLLDRRAAGWIASALYLAGLLVTGDHVVLWNPSLLPIPMVLATVATLLLARDGRTRWALAGAFWTALAIESHVQSLVLLAVFLAAALLWARRPFAAWLGATVVCAVVLLAGSASALSEAVFRAGRSISSLHAVVAAAGGALCLLARRLAGATERARIVQVLALQVAFFAAALLATAPLIPGGGVQVRYLHVVLPAASVLASYVLLLLGSRWPRVSRLVDRAAPAVWALPVVVAIWLSRQPVTAPWTLQDVQSIVRDANLPSGPERFRSWLDAADCRSMARALSTLSDTPARTVDDPLTVWRIGPRPGTSPPRSDPAGVHSLLLGGNAVQVSSLRSWLDRQAVALCLTATPGDEQCATLGASDWENAMSLSRSFVPFSDARLAQIRRAPRFRATYRFTVHVDGDDPARWFGVAEGADDPCGWHIAGPDGEPHAGHLRVDRLADGTAAVTAFKEFANDACRTREIEALIPPCLFESRDREDALRAAVSGWARPE